MAAPPGLSASLLRLGGDEFAVLEWPLAAPEPPPGLTAAEREVFRAIAAGRSNREIARRRRTAERTVANQVARLLQKCGAGSRHELIARAGAAPVDAGAPVQAGAPARSPAPAGRATRPRGRR